MIWRASDVRVNGKYRLYLCESNEGKRFFKLIEIGSDNEDQSYEVIYISEPISQNINEALKRGDLLMISEAVLLEDGHPFFVDAHGTWLTESEVKEMDADVNFNDIHWATGRVPNFAPK